MSLGRIARHLLAAPRQTRRAFPAASLAAIEQAIRQSEAAHCGEIRFAVEGALEAAPLLAGQSARQRALEVFSQLRVWDTAHNNGVLVYLLLADRDVEIVADRGIHACAGAPEWERICRGMEAALAQGRYEAAVVDGILAVAQIMARHFPADPAQGNELPDKPALL